MNALISSLMLEIVKDADEEPIPSEVKVPLVLLSSLVAGPLGLVPSLVAVIRAQNKAPVNPSDKTDAGKLGGAAAKLKTQQR